MTQKKADPTANASTPLGWTDVLKDEHNHLFGEEVAPEKDPGEALAARRLIALCLSGGGIRSASFSLGVMQALARYSGSHAGRADTCQDSLLAEINYLSTVSGGGYTGSWYSAALKRLGFQQLWKELSGPGISVAGGSDGKLVTWLRAYSNFITPRVGLFSGDTWTVLAIVMRNILLIWLNIIPALVIGALTVKLFDEVLYNGRLADSAFQEGDWASWLVAGGLVFHIMSVAAVTQYRLRIALTGISTQSTRPVFVTNLACIAPALVAYGLYVTAAAWVLPHKEFTKLSDLGPFAWALPIAVGGAAAGWLFGALCCFADLKKHAAAPNPDRVKIRSSPTHRELQTYLMFDFLRWTLIAGLLFGALVLIGTALGANTIVSQGISTCHLDTVPPNRMAAIALAVLGVPWLAVSQQLCEAVFVGATSVCDMWAPISQGRMVEARELEREWLAKFGGRLVMLAFAWLAFSAAILAVPLVIEHCAPNSAGLTPLVGGLSGIITLVLGWSRHSPAAGAAKSPVGLSLNVILAIAAPIFGVLLLAGVSVFCDLLLHTLCWLLGNTALASVPGARALSSPIPLGLMLTALAALALYFTASMNINRFSLHSLYRNRLERAFLGASNFAVDQRRGDPYVGMDMKDNMQMKDLTTVRESDPRILHIINMALNTVASSRYAWQERKAAPFTVSPLHCGSSLISATDASPRGVYRRSSEYGGPSGMSLATAMAISGAAASPNMGYHSSPGITFLMAMFNIRLGWWLGNPRCNETFQTPGPRFSLKAFAWEAFGLTNERRSYVYLSDGGHFENLGMYEMVLRRCRYLIVCDAGCDEKSAYEDLGNAARKIEIDLGVRISFPPLTHTGAPSVQPPYPPAFSVGRILYSRAESENGYILYIKPSLAFGNEPVGVRSYAKSNPAFPHDSTADQWFSESQMESYRELAVHIVEQILAQAGPHEDGLPGLIRALWQKSQPARPGPGAGTGA